MGWPNNSQYSPWIPQQPTTTQMPNFSGGSGWNGIPTSYPYENRTPATSPTLPGMAGSNQSASRAWGQTYSSTDPNNIWNGSSEPQYGSLKNAWGVIKLALGIPDSTPSLPGGAGNPFYQPPKSQPFMSNQTTVPGGPLAQPIKYWTGVTPSDTTSGTTGTSATDDPNVWYKNLVATGGTQTRAQFDLAWNDPEKRPLLQAQIAANMAKLGNTTGGTSGGGGSGGNSNGYVNNYPGLYSYYHVDPSWVSAYQAKHGGLDPVSDYGGSGAVVNAGTGARWSQDRTPDQTLRSAEWDKSWGDAFARLHGHAPTDQDWTDTYLYREALKQSGANPNGG
jgi:hypothetical protein